MVMRDDRLQVRVAGAQHPDLLDEILRVLAGRHLQDRDIRLVHPAPHRHVEGRGGRTGEIHGEAILELDHEAHCRVARELVRGARAVDRTDIADQNVADLVPVAGARAQHLLDRNFPGLEPDAEHLETGDDLGVGGEGNLVGRADLVGMTVGDDDDVGLGEIGDLDRTVRIGHERIGQDDFAGRRGQAKNRPGEPFELDRVTRGEPGGGPDEAER